MQRQDLSVFKTSNLSLNARFVGMHCRFYSLAGLRLVDTVIIGLTVCFIHYSLGLLNRDTIVRFVCNFSCRHHY